MTPHNMNENEPVSSTQRDREPTPTSESRIMPIEPRTGMTILDINQCWALLRQAEVARLAVSIMNRPDIFPINYVVDHGRVVFRTAEGTKLAASVLGDAVAFEVDGYDAGSGDAWSVVIKGTAVEIENMHDLFDAADLPLFPWHAAPKPRFVSIEPEEITGRRFHVVDPSGRDATQAATPRTAPE